MMSEKPRPTDREIAERFRSHKVNEVQAEVLARIRGGNPMTFEQMAEALDVPVDVVISGFKYSMLKATLKGWLPSDGASWQ